MGPLAFALAALIGAGCAVTPQANNAVESARSTYRLAQDYRKAEAALATSGEQRNRVLLEARSRELEAERRNAEAQRLKAEEQRQSAAGC